MKATKQPVRDQSVEHPATTTVDCGASELSDRCFNLACLGYKITAQEPTAQGGWRIQARRCDCDVCSEGRQERARRSTPQAVRPQNGKAFFEKLRREIGS
jgi:hypothetical protein